MFNSFSTFDPLDPDKPIKKYFTKNTLANESAYHQYDLVLHNLELSDNNYSPLQTSEEQSYLTLNRREITNVKFPFVLYAFTLANDIVIEKRTRYSVWDLLGDVGGFNDGLILVC